MLTTLKRLAAIALARLDKDERDRAVRKGHIMVNIERKDESGVWTPVNLDAEVVEAAKEFRSRRNALHADG